MIDAGFMRALGELILLNPLIVKVGFSYPPTLFCLLFEYKFHSIEFIEYYVNMKSKLERMAKRRLAMKMLLAITIFLAMLCGAIHTGTGNISISAGTSVVYAGGNAPMDGEVNKP
ncbi:MAG: hypothetical protein BWK80_62445 [Desulfobacteraceae bacterium IS3]|nr:MAG: hypothetical protein BWK80_62445 [Desulfobacteraceae bacterium IS3]